MKATFEIDFNKKYIKLYEPKWKIATIFYYMKNALDGHDINVASYWNLEEYAIVELKYRGDLRSVLRKVEKVLSTYKHQA